MGRLFGTDGVRGVANTELTAELAFSLGRAGAAVLSTDAGRRPKIVIGKDTRVSSDLLEAAMIAGICSAGADALSLGVIPTPAVAYLTSSIGANAGVVISASHNSYEFNGIKFFDSRGMKLPDAVERQIETLTLEADEDYKARPSGAKVGRFRKPGAPKERYIDWLLGDGSWNLNSQGMSRDLSGVKVALDCANGAASDVAPRAFEKLGADVRVVSATPNGANINDGCGSTHLSNLKVFMSKVGADVGFSFDGDADRLLAIDENGEIVDGDRIIAMLALDMKRRGELPHNTVVATVMSNLGLEMMTRRNGMRLLRTQVGDRYVLEAMTAGGFALGGEQSGHIICMDRHTTGDGLYAALKLARLMREQNKRFSEMANVMLAMPQVIRNARVSNELKNAYLEDDVIRVKCEEIEAEFAGAGRALIRPSGTEPLVRVMIEAADVDAISRKADELANLIEARLGGGA